MKIPVGKIAAWIGRTLLTAIVSHAADRLARARPTDRRRDDGQNVEDRHRTGE